MLGATEPMWPNERSEFEAFIELIEGTDAREPYKPKLIKPGSHRVASSSSPSTFESKPARQWGNRGSQQLLDRELLEESTYGLSAGEACALAAYFGSSPTPSARRILTRDEMLTGVGGFLAQTAALTASSIAEAAAIPVQVIAGDTASGKPAIRLGGRQLVVERGAGRMGDVVRWWPTQSAQPQFSVEIDDLDLGLSVSHRDFVLDELSPLPISEIRTDLLTRIGKPIERSPHQADLSIKHLLARHVFSATANRGIATHLCTTVRPGKKNASDAGETDSDAELADDEDLDEGEESKEQERRGDGPTNVRRESLSNYIHPQSAAVRHAYRRAVSAIRYPDERVSDAEQKPREACEGDSWVHPAKMSEIMAWLAVRALDRNKKTAIQHHNDFVLYVAAMLVVAVGHRRARAVVPFLHDLDFQDAIAFIADKLREGSEARFVPLVAVLVEQLQAYLAHVQFLIAQLSRTEPQLAESIRVAVGLVRLAGGHPAARHTGPLFRIRGKRAVPVTTAAVDWAIREAVKAIPSGEPLRIETRVLRRNLATWLADDGVSGSHVEVLLGHVRQMHPFGSASIWIPLEEFDRLREPLDRYAAQMGCKSIGAPWARAFSGRLSVPAPSFERSPLAYEGRQIEADEARLRARQVVLDVVPVAVLLDDQAVDLGDADLQRIEAGIRTKFSKEPKTADEIVVKLYEMAATWRRDEGYAAPRSELFKPATPTELALSDDSNSDTALDAIRRVAIRVLKKSQVQGQRVILLDDATVQKLSSEIDIELKEDPAARAKAKAAFAELADGWRRSGKYRVTAAALNLTRFAPGPVDISFSRHLSLAKAVLEGLPDRIESYLIKEKSSKASLAVVAVLLVCCEAVLNRAELAPLLDALQSDGLAKFEGQLQMRASYIATDAEYDRTADLTYKTAAAVSGYLRRRQSETLISFPEIEAAANDFLKLVTLPHGSINLQRLVIAMRPYWFLRMPGSVYASITGQHECNAPSPASMSLLLGAEPPKLRIAPPAPRGPTKQRASDIEAALAAVAELLNDAEGKISEFQGASRNQRMRLREDFSSRHRPKLDAWTMRMQIVDLAVQFVYYMLEVGGFRVQTYSFNSLQTYRRRVLREIFEVAWNVNLLAYGAEGLSLFFRAVIARVQPDQRQFAKSPLRLFLRFLHEWHGAANTRYDANTESRPRRSRNVVIPARIVEQAVMLATQPDGKGSQVAKAGATLLGIDHAFGLRPEEGYGLKVTDFPEQAQTSVRVRVNVIRSLKTLQRSVPISLASDTTAELLSARATAASAKGREAHFALFAIDDRIALFDDAHVYAVGNWAVKRATGDRNAIAYSLRHTFATSVMSHMLVPAPEASLIALKIADSLRLPGKAQIELKRLKPKLTRWPFQIYRLGAWMGHSGHGTLSQTYWHGAWWVAGEICSREALQQPWKSEAIGALMGVTGAALRKRFPPRKDGKRETDAIRTANAIAGIVQGMELPELKLDQALESKQGEAKAQQSERPVVSVLDAMLMQRRLGKEDLPDIPAAAAERLCVPLQQAKSFYAAYEEVGSSTSMLDFEPDVLRPVAFNALDVDSGADRRDLLLAMVVERMAADKKFALATLEFLSEWQREVDGDHLAPKVVSRSIDRLRQQVNFFKLLNYNIENLRAWFYAANSEQVEECVKIVPNAEPSNVRLSRANKIGQPTEYGLVVSDSRRLPDGRDLHRVLLALACAVAAGLLDCP